MHTKLSSAVIVPSKNGYYLKKENGNFSCLKDIIIPGETSWQCARRILAEQAGEYIENFEYLGIIEFLNKKITEICFVYFIEYPHDINPLFDLIDFNKEEIKNLNICPQILKKILLQKQERSFSHFIES